MAVNMSNQLLDRERMADSKSDEQRIITELQAWLEKFSDDEVTIEDILGEGMAE
jgi:hypothetical protein